MLHAAILAQLGRSRPASARSLPTGRWRCRACTASSPRPISAARSRRCHAAATGLPQFEPFAPAGHRHAKVRYVGALAVVLAQSAALAEDALEAIGCRDRAAPADRGHGTPRRKINRLLFRGHRQHSRIQFHAVLGDCRRGLPGGPPINKTRALSGCSGTWRLPMDDAAASWRNGMRCAGASPSIGRRQGACSSIRRTLARQMGLAEGAMTWWRTMIGGGFGRGGEFLSGRFSHPCSRPRHVGRPVKWNGRTGASSS